MVTLNEWLDEIISMLECNATKDFKDCFRTYELTEKEIYNNLPMLKILFENGYTPSKALDYITN